MIYGLDEDDDDQDYDDGHYPPPWSLAFILDLQEELALVLTTKSTIALQEFGLIHPSIHLSIHP